MKHTEALRRNIHAISHGQQIALATATLRARQPRRSVGGQEFEP